MLSIRKANAKKLIIYLFIIALMFSGTGYFIYKIFSITPRTAIDNTKSFFTKRLSDEDGENSGAVGQKQLNLNIDEASALLETTIFNDPKFKNLKGIDVDLTITEKVGNENPFSIKKDGE